MELLSRFARIVVRNAGKSLMVSEPDTGEILWDIPVQVGVHDMSNIYRTLPDALLGVMYDPSSEDIILLPVRAGMQPIVLDDEDQYASSANPDFVVTSQARSARELDRRMRRLELREQRAVNREIAERRAADSVEPPQPPLDEKDDNDDQAPLPPA